MKKKYLTYAGIISAIILISMFCLVFLTQFPAFFLPAFISLDPGTNWYVDDNNMMIVTGTTNLPVQSPIILAVSPVSGRKSMGNETTKELVRGNAWIIPGTDGWNSWKGTIDLSRLVSGEYEINMKTFHCTKNATSCIENTIATDRFTLLDDTSAIPGIRKKTITKQPFIRINPIPEKTDGTTLKVTGITSEEPGTSLVWTIAGQGDPVQAKPVLQGNVTVIPGIDKVHRWSFTINADTLEPSSYRITISPSPHQNLETYSEKPVSGYLDFFYQNDILFSVPFNDTIRNSPANASGFITIDALPELQVDDVYVLTGTTNLPFGAELLLEVRPPSFLTDYHFSFDPRDKSEKHDFSGATGLTTVVNGTGGENLWSFILETYQMEPARYEVYISTITFDPVSSLPVLGSEFCSRDVFIRGRSS